MRNQKPKRDLLGINSVSSLSGQAVKLSALGEVAGAANELAKADKLKGMTGITVFYLIMKLQEDYGLRISEVLNINGLDISVKGKLKINAAKGSEDRIVQLSGDLLTLITYAGSNIKVFNGISRQSVWRYYRKLGFVKVFKDSVNQSVTHQFRYEYLTDLKNITNDIELRQRSIGHKNLNNTKRYEQKE